MSVEFRNRDMRKWKDLKIWMVRTSAKREQRRTRLYPDPSFFFSLSVETDRSRVGRGRKRSLVRLDGRKYLRGGGSRARRK